MKHHCWKELALQRLVILRERDNTIALLRDANAKLIDQLADSPATRAKKWAAKILEEADEVFGPDANAELIDQLADSPATRTEKWATRVFGEPNMEALWKRINTLTERMDNARMSIQELRERLERLEHGPIYDG